MGADPGAGAGPAQAYWDNEPGIGRGKSRAEGVAAFMGTLATKLVLLPPRDPESKRIVERRNGWFETSFMPGRSFESPDDFKTQFAGWLDRANNRVVRTPVEAIPPCWPRHQHLVHELAVLADQRRKAIYSYTGDALEEWHRYSLPQFIERLKRRVGDQCNEGHPAPWPANGRFIHHLNDPAAMQRHATYVADLKESPWGPRRRTRQIVDPETGEILE